MSENATASSRPHDAELHHNGLVYECRVLGAEIPKEHGGNEYAIDVEIPAAQVTDELLTVLREVQYVEVVDSDLIYHIDGTVPRYVRRGDKFVLQYEGHIVDLHISAK